MSIGVCGMIQLINHSVDEIVDLSCQLHKITAIHKIGIKMGGNISEDVYKLYSNCLNKNNIAFELMDSPLDNYAEELFQPCIGDETINYEQEFFRIMTFNLSKILSLFQAVLSSKIVEFINFDINYMFRETDNRLEISINEFINFVLKEYKKSNFFVPTINLKIKK